MKKVGKSCPYTPRGTAKWKVSLSLLTQHKSGIGKVDIRSSISKAESEIKEEPRDAMRCGFLLKKVGGKRILLTFRIEILFPPPPMQTNRARY